MVRGPNLHGGREVEDNTIVMGWSCPPPSRFHSLADPDCEVRFCLRESLRTVLVSELCSEISGALVGQLTDKFRVLDSQFDGLFLRVTKHDLAESWAGSIVHVQDRFFAPSHGFNGPLDQVFASRRQDLDEHGLHQ